MSNVLALAAVALAAGFVLTRKSSEPADMARAGSPEPLHAGVPYLFIVRLEKSDDEARSVLTPKGVTDLQFSPASAIPFWTKPGETYSTRVAAFRATPQGNSTITLGDPFYGVGRLEKVVRLDGQAFSLAPGV